MITSPIRVGDYVEARYPQGVYQGTVTDDDPAQIGRKSGEWFGVIMDGCGDRRVIVWVERKTITRHVPGTSSTPPAPSNTMAPMLENDAPETQEPKTPEPEEEKPPKAVHLATIMAVDAMCKSALALLSDPDTTRIDEAILTLETAATLVAGPQDAAPTFLQTLAESLEKNMPLLIQAAMQLGASYGEQKRSPFDGAQRGRITQLDDYDEALLRTTGRIPRSRFRVDSAGNARDVERTRADLETAMDTFDAAINAFIESKGEGGGLPASVPPELVVAVSELRQAVGKATL